MRTSVNLPDEAITAVRDRAADAKITPAEWMRQALIAACTPSEHPGTPLDDEERTRLEDAIRTAEADRDQAREDLARLETGIRTAAADRDRLAAELRTVQDQARAEASAAAVTREDLAARVRDLEEERHALDLRIIRAEVEVERARGEAAAAHQAAESVAAEKNARIDDLRRTLATLEGQLATMTTIANRAIPENTGTGRRPWWQFWRRATG